jgi:penicillin-insensitive murein endopeptidase
MPSGHASHQIGLDVDLWYRLDAPTLTAETRERPALPSVVDARTERVDPARWSAAHAAFVRLAASDPRVARVFVHPAVKQALCAAAGTDRAWLRRVRPWFGHDDHMHVRLACPADSSGCASQSDPPSGDGCGAELSRWLDPRTRPRPTPHDGAPDPMPSACADVLVAPQARPSSRDGG